ncbi:radical SAM family heme chaperone HemW [Oceanicella actignis]|uniref:radical SAM family heme chaperone HemW n=1 Tax=Oceanicella actignis TaxID=1189325 RepID=UPI0011E6BEF5|nr:radical SAM family heme chaperone HemW [Oceanicella actignis]TYO90557.1 oxygen-independent coproporphyrinogen-3 oxidase [Oceanicella actignis]
MPPEPFAIRPGDAPPAARPAPRPSAPEGAPDPDRNRATAPAPDPGATEDWRAGGFGIYVHWPFCKSKCPYCDFNSHVSAHVDHDAWRQALIADLEAAARLTPGRRARTMFFGGGTPSLMPPATVAALIDAVERLWGFEPGAEITLEANPTSVEAAAFRGYAAAGVNRVSMGVQALNDADLRALGRTHGAAEAMAAFDVARAVFRRVSFDLIYARQNQTPQAWEAELRRALDLAADHLSLYQLTIEPGTRFAQLHARGRLRGLPADDDAARMYELTQELCEAAGMPAYEISNHARPGDESRHNLIYWRYGDYVGAGPGAHGRLTVEGRRLATENLRAPGAWLEAMRAGRPAASFEEIAPEDQAAEYLLMSLRLAEGTDPARHARLGGRPFDPERVARLVEQGVLTWRAERLAATRKGRALLDAALRELVA